MNILFITNCCVGFMVSDIPRVSIFGHCPYSVTFPYTYKIYKNTQNMIYKMNLKYYNFVIFIFLNHNFNNSISKR